MLNVFTPVRFLSVWLAFACVMLHADETAPSLGLINTADASSSKIPDVAGPVIYNDPNQPTDLRIDDLIRRMSLSEKVSQLVNDAAAIPRLNIPAYENWNFIASREQPI